MQKLQYFHQSRRSALVSPVHYSNNKESDVKIIPIFMSYKTRMEHKNDKDILNIKKSNDKNGFFE